MFTIPEKLKLANLPTRIQRMDRLSTELSRNMYIKRDDETGIELSGNKVRKLEYSLAEAQRMGASVIITCGALQSNHARATAVSAVKLGMETVLVLMEGKDSPINGNYMLDLLLGARIVTVSQEDYQNNLEQIMEDLKKEYEEKGKTAYTIPIGASNAIGMFGYIEAIEEIIEQEKEMQLHFDVIVDTVGSAGSYAGLVVGNALYHGNYGIIGISIGASKEYFIDKSFEMIEACCQYLSFGLEQPITAQSLGIRKEDLMIIDAHRGEGYAKNTKEDFKFIQQFAQMEGIFLDPVYTGKAMKGLCKEIDAANKGVPSETGEFNFYKNILFIHTGGLYGMFPKADEMFEE